MICLEHPHAQCHQLCISIFPDHQDCMKCIDAMPIPLCPSASGTRQSFDNQSITGDATQVILNIQRHPSWCTYSLKESIRPSARYLRMYRTFPFWDAFSLLNIRFGESPMPISHSVHVYPLKLLRHIKLYHVIEVACKQKLFSMARYNIVQRNRLRCSWTEVRGPLVSEPPGT